MRIPMAPAGVGSHGSPGTGWRRRHSCMLEVREAQDLWAQGQWMQPGRCRAAGSLVLTMAYQGTQRHR